MRIGAAWEVNFNPSSPFDYLAKQSMSILVTCKYNARYAANDRLSRNWYAPLMHSFVRKKTCTQGTNASTSCLEEWKHTNTLRHSWQPSIHLLILIILLLLVLLLPNPQIVVVVFSVTP